MAKFKVPSARVEAAKGRRGASAAARNVRIEWYIRNVSDKIAITMKGRVMLATELVKSKVVQNISTPVVKGKGSRGGYRVTGRSKPGEFPHAETTQLMKGIFGEVRKSVGGWDGYIGTPHHYGVILELRMNRRFLTRTLEEERPKVMRILAGPIK